MTQSEKRDRIAKLTNYMQRLEGGWYCGEFHPEIKEGLYYFNQVYLKLPEYERQEKRKEWNDYYASSRTGRELPKPVGYDPMEWEHCEWAMWYRTMKKTLAELQTPQEQEWEQVTGGNSW